MQPDTYERKYAVISHFKIIHIPITGLPDVHLIKGYSTATALLYGVAKDSQSHVVSEDMGETWTDVSDEEFTEASLDQSYVAATVIPMENSLDLTPGRAPTATFTSGTWGGET